ncbi:thermonuclease family protein [Jhaorihella thermophila]|uniref:Endonuclease YncB, thermonuclease family n=1 Tax=Jhaorihella thermophila TaxID=488547 RepID=A0A1H5YEX6_9RHOB|nr:thermonuclease family protein [Jhaorihella thermophila]SEG22514.1 Endonuclease YncB, thermonuclease family [Jhaorihella thermophila]
MLRNCSLLVLVVAVLPVLALAGPSGTVRVIDADTWRVGGEKVRLFGIDAPELGQPCTWPDRRDRDCGRWAAQETRRRFEGRTAICERIATDRYGRTVARCFVEGADAARVMVSEGIAFAYRRYSMDYDLDEKRAVVTGRGLHAATLDRPAEFRRARGAPPPARGCVIKGNISRGGRRIYHVPGQRDYDRTRISPSKGERWFCSEAEAQAAGWRRARN